VTVHAFIDESGRERSYLVCVGVVAPAQLTSLRQQMRGLLLPRQRELHFKKEKAPRRRQLADAIAKLDVAARVYSTDCTPKTDELARQRCLRRAVEDLLADGCHRLVLDTREHRNVHDKVTLQAALGARPSKTELTYEHLDSTLEPLLWISDAVAWCYGAGGDWKRRVTPVVERVIRL
jgi:hypothetical protein